MLQSVLAASDLDDHWLTRTVDDDDFSSSLVYIQTSLQKAEAGNHLHQWLNGIMPTKPLGTVFKERKNERATEIETSIRHASWLSDREKLLSALRSDPANGRRVRRIEDCGAHARFQVSADGSGVRIYAYYCGDRLCRRCSLSRACRMAKNIEVFTHGEVIRFATLTRRSNGETLQEAIAGLRRAHQNLLRSDFWSRHVSGSIWFYEITRGFRGDHWHCHCHGLLRGQWIAQRDLSRIWERCTHGSYVVDVRRANGGNEIAWYVTTYAAQILDADILKSPSLTLEASNALRSVRLCGTTGSAAGVRLCHRPSSKENWKTIATVDQVVHHAAQNQPYAIGLLKAVKRNVEITRDGELSIKIERKKVDRKETDPANVDDN